jgi:hypothetical protein
VTHQFYRDARSRYEACKRLVTELQAAEPVTVTHPQDHARPWSDDARREFDSARRAADKADERLKEARQSLAVAESERNAAAIALAETVAPPDNFLV